MLTFTCGSFTVPLEVVDSISWSKRAKTITTKAGYVIPQGYEPAEISVKFKANYTVLKQMGLDADEVYSTLKSFATDRKSISSCVYIAGYPIYPELEFTPTNINRTYAADLLGSYALELDVVFSGVKRVKEVVRERALELEPWLGMPKLTLRVGSKELIIQDSFHVNEFTVQPDSIQFTVSIGSDMDLVSRDGFLDAFTKGGEVIADLPQGKTTYYVIDANLVDEQLSITGSIYPPKALKILSRTYQNTTLKKILMDLATEAGCEMECKTDGKVDYYCAFGTPVECIKQLQSSAGFLISYRQGKITCVDVPEFFTGKAELEYMEMSQDSESEPLNGLYWMDGVNQFTAGLLDSTAQKVYSAFRSSEDYSIRCLKFYRYQRNMITVSSDLDPNIDSHSAVIVQSNDRKVHAMVEWYTQNFIDNTASYELHYERA